MITISIEKQEDDRYLIDVTGESGITEEWTTSSPQRTVLKVLRELNIVGRKGRRKGSKNIVADASPN